MDSSPDMMELRNDLPSGHCHYLWYCFLTLKADGHRDYDSRSPFFCFDRSCFDPFMFCVKSTSCLEILIKKHILLPCLNEKNHSNSHLFQIQRYLLFVSEENIFEVLFFIFVNIHFVRYKKE